MTTLSQRSFSSGELSPSLYARVDLVRYATGLRTCKNNIVLRYGGVANRPGTSYIGEASDPDNLVRLIPFVFNSSQTYVLEFGDQYMRVIKSGDFVKINSSNITDITQASPGVVTSAGHPFSNGDDIYISGVIGMVEVNNRYFRVSNATANTFTLELMDGSGDLDTSGFSAYSSSGTVEEVYKITTPYLSAELFTLDYVQSADVISIAHPNHPPYELSRTGDSSWSLDLAQFQPDISFPTGISASAGGAGSNTYKYIVTAIDSESGEESLPGNTSSTASISGATQADPCVITATAHGFSNDDQVRITGVVGMTELNDRIFYIDNVAANTFQLVDIDSTNYTAWSSGGTATKVNYTLSSAAAPSTSAPHTISWTKVADAIEYNIYKESNGVYGQIGVASGTSFKDINIGANTTLTPPASRTPFIGSGNYPSTVTYIQQRKAYANTDNDPEKIWLSRTGNFNNFTTSNPAQDDDAITFTMAGRQVNEVRNMIDLGRLVILTSGGEWSAAGNEAGIITPSSINTKQYSYNGSGELPPIIIDGAAIYQQARGSIIRDLAYDLNVDGYSGNDLTIFSAHLFDEYTLVDWTYQQIPHSILWVVRSDGVLLGLTFVRNQQVLAWHRHDLGGTVESVTSIPDGNEDRLYVVVKRTINGVDKRYIEKLNTRQISDIKDSIFMDSAYTYDGRNTTATTMTLSGGTNWTYDEDLTLTASASYFVSSDVGNSIHLLDSSGQLIRAKIKSYTSATVVTINPNKTVPTSLRSTAAASWSKAINTISGLNHLEGEDVSVFGDGFVVASPNNASYDTVTVTDGSVTLSENYSVIHIGIPYLSDLETLNIDTAGGETISDKKQIVGKVNLFVEETRGIWAGAEPPADDSVDPLSGLTELKIRNTESYDSPVSLTTKNVSIVIQPQWNSNGRVFIRQVDPVPMTILSINPAGKFPFNG